jgi:DNA-binding GntR family transcriptional regulator
MDDDTIYRTIPAQIAEHLRYEILSGKFKPGQPLREQEVSERFGVSRGPIREALRLLTQQGLLVAEPNKGVKVAENLGPKVRPLVSELRRTIELFVLDSAFDRITDEIDVLDDILADIKDACQQGDTAALVGHDLRFHTAIIQCHDVQDVFSMWQPIVLRMLMQYNRFDDLMDSYREHKRIVEAIRAGDKAEAMAALKANIQ